MQFKNLFLAVSCVMVTLFCDFTICLETNSLDMTKMECLSRRLGYYSHGSSGSLNLDWHAIGLLRIFSHFANQLGWCGRKQRKPRFHVSNQIILHTGSTVIALPLGQFQNFSLPMLFLKVILFLKKREFSIIFGFLFF